MRLMISIMLRDDLLVYGIRMKQDCHGCMVSDIALHVLIL